VAERRRLQELHGGLAKLVEGDDVRRYHRMNEQFHRTIYAGSHNDYLAELTSLTRTRLSPFSHLQFRALGRLNHSHAEHDKVVAAILRRDRPAAVAAMRRHISTVEITYERYIETA
jgi:DNA-binding GntR family transcriptional regulator